MYVCNSDKFFFFLSFRFNGSGGPCGHLIKQTGPSSCSLSLAHPRFPSRVLQLWKAWTASRSSRSTVMIDPLTACHLLTLGEHVESWYGTNICRWFKRAKLYKTVMFCFSSSALTSWTFQPTRATRSWDICCCWPFRNAPRDSDWLKLWDS